MVGTLSETRQENLKVMWEIDDFLSLPGPYGCLARCIASPAFRFSDYSLRLVVYPYGDGTEGSAVGLYLSLDDEAEEYPSTESTVIFTLAVKKADGTFYTRSPLSCRFENNLDLGFSKMLARSDLEEKKDEFLPGDALTFSCILRNVPPVEAMDARSANLEKLFLSSAHSDVTVKLQSREYRAHRAILAAQSDEFASALEHDALERESGIIQIDDCDPNSFKEFLQYLYTGRAHIDDGNVYHLIRTADKYLVGELKALCVAYLIDNMSVDNLCDAVVFADDHSIFSLQAFCNKFFCDHFASVLGTEKWLSLMKERNVVANGLLEHFSMKYPC